MGSDGFYDNEWPQLRPGLNETYGALRDALVAAIGTFTTLTWPPELQDDIDDLIAETSLHAAAASSAASAETVEQWQAAMEQFGNLEFKAAAIIRAKLGLPTNLTSERVEGC